MFMMRVSTVLLLLVLMGSCKGQPTEQTELSGAEATRLEAQPKSTALPDTSWTTIHVFVALCDNKYQGIVPVPAAIGNGQDPDNNLYWGCGFGIRTYFKKSKDWQLIHTEKVDSVILERLVFRHRTKKFYLIADAYNGKYIRQCTKDFLSGSCGKQKEVVEVDNRLVGIAGHARLLAYIGHDGLMDFKLKESYVNTDNSTRDLIILACYSKRYFAPKLKQAKVNPLVWTTGLMCPEAYTIHDAIASYIDGKDHETIRTRAALAYAKYQKCSEKAARGLLVTGW